MSDIKTLEVENRMLRERNERLETEHKTMHQMLDKVLDESIQLREDLKTAMAAYRQMLLKIDKLEQRCVK